MRHTRLPPLVSFLGLGGAVLACANPFAEPQPPAPVEVEPEAAAPEAPASPERASWPLLKMGTVPGGRTVPLPADLLDVDVHPSGRFAVGITGAGDATSVWTWDFAGALMPVAIEGAREAAFSPFDGALYVVTHRGGWKIERGTLEPGLGWAPKGTVYTSAAPLSSLVAPFTRYDDEERVFFAREASPGRTQILGVRRSGERPYEVTSPTGALGELTPPELRNPPADSYTVAPVALAAASAAPLSLHPVTGALLWRDDAGQVRARAWDPGVGNWAADEVMAPAGESWTWSPNGYYAIVWSPAAPAVRFRHPDGALDTISGPTFRAPPVSAANGRTLIGWTDAGLITLSVPLPLAPVRYLTAASVPDATRDALARDGIALTDGDGEQLYDVYDDLLYGSPQRPVFASVDGLLEVLHVGFQAVFVRVEREVSRPRLEAFLTALEAAAIDREEKRVREIAVATKRMLAGDYAFPEGERVLAETLAESELHRDTIDFQDFHPRGPYATSPDLQTYFRAFKYIDRLQLTPEERKSLLGDAALVTAWKAWVEAQGPFLSGTRYDGMFGDGWVKPPYLRAECLPTAVRERPLRVFPLSWGRDSEILERSVAHDDLPAGCTVPQRVMPSGLDLMTGLGSAEAAALQRAEYGLYPELEATHLALRERFGGEIDSARFVDAWMRLVQLLGTETHVPEGVSQERWRRRLLETALASWTSFRHTTVLVNEGTAAQMGGGAEDVFETISVEPVRGVVDPVPAAWAQTARLLDALATTAKASPTTDRLAEVLAEAAASATRLEGLAVRQMMNEPLTDEDYQFVVGFAGVVEHPYLLSSAAAAGTPDVLAAPEPMMRIVDIHAWKNPRGPVEHWHAAVGRPREITVLLGDRGVLVPGSGAVYGYHEVIADHRLDDAEWRSLVDTAPRPAWATPSLPTPPPPPTASTP
ncbi:MAG: DUF3160 domain-containing protein [Pseudomonadota bacterium]|nr:DUF3160 domain-containing protein [Pseudomonadota bacterium]